MKGSFDVGTIVFKQKTTSGLPTRRRPGSPSEGLSRVLLRRVPKTFWSVVLVMMVRSRGRRIAAARARPFFFPAEKTVCQAPNLLKHVVRRRISTIISAGSNRSDPTWNLSRFVRVGPARARALAGASRVASGSSVHRRSRTRHPRSERGVRTVNVVCWFAFSMPARSREKEEKSASRSDARANQREGASPETRP